MVRFADGTPIDPSIVERMTAALAHRGPDAQRVEPVDAHAHLGFCRLAILDLDPRAMQPMHSADERYTLVFNGEIYNYRELRSELADYPFRTTGDSEVILAAFARFGDAAIDRLNGMFALALYDRDERSLLLARDRTGQKPLYVAGLRLRDGSIERTRDAIVFASELRSLALAGIDTQLDLATIATYLSLGYVPSGERIGDAMKLPPGAVVRIDTNSATIRFIDTPAAPADDRPIVERTRSLVEQAVARQLVSDVPLGCFLSGGIDSSIVALCMTRALGDAKRVRTFSIGFDDPLYDETAHAAEVAKHLGTTHEQFTVTPDAAVDLPALARAFGEPFADSSALPTHYLARETRRHVTVALAGDGGDELFGGYDRYRAVRIGQSLDRLPRWVRSTVSGALRPLLPGTHPKRRAVRLKRFLESSALSAGERYASYMRLFSPALVRELTGREGESFDTLGSQYAALLAQRHPVPAALELDRRTYLPDDLHTKVDRASMLHSLEVRAPFMDIDLLAMARTLDTDQLLAGGGKRLLREAFAPDLPASVFSRAKMGFAVPIGSWFRSSLKSLLIDTLHATNSIARQRLSMPVVDRLIEEHIEDRADHSQRLYALLMLEMTSETKRRRDGETK